MKQAEYQEICPKDERLKKFIKLYYVHQSTDPDFYQKITYYPNYNTSVNIYQNSDVTLEPFSRTHRFQKTDQYLKLLVAKFEVSREIIQVGPFNKLTIVFKPLGLNHFLNQALSKITETHCSEFSAFGQMFDGVIHQVFQDNDMAQKRDLLDDFFVGQLSCFEENNLKQTVDAFIASAGSGSLKQLAEELKTSRKTLLRLFKSKRQANHTL